MVTFAVVAGVAVVVAAVVADAAAGADYAAFDRTADFAAGTAYSAEPRSAPTDRNISSATAARGYTHSSSSSPYSFRSNRS